MAKRGRKRSSEIDLATLIVVGVVLMSFAYTKNLETAMQLGLIVLLFGGSVVGLIVYLRRNCSRVESISQERSPPVKRAPENPAPGHVDREFERRFQQKNTTGAEKPVAWSLELIRSLDWKRFEELCAAYFEAKGRNTQVTALGSDGGIDIVLFGDSDPEKVLGIVQCKAWTQKPVGVREVRELLGVMTHVGCPLGVYVTTSGYTPDAKTFAEGKDIKLLDAGQLLALIQKLAPEIQTQLLQRITSGDYTTPSCPNCGIKLVSRTSHKNGNAGQGFWGCRNFPRCRYTMHRAKSA